MIIFDFDDTLFEGRLQRQVRSLLPQSIRLQLQSFRLTHSYYRMTQLMFQRLNQLNFSRTELKQALAQRCRLLPGCKQFLNELIKRGKKLGIISGGDKFLIKLILQAFELDDCFQFIFTAVETHYDGSQYLFKYLPHQHQCYHQGCASDFCKRQVFLQLNLPDYTVSFVADGANDACLAKQVQKKNGKVFPRAGFDLSREMKDCQAWNNLQELLIFL